MKWVAGSFLGFACVFNSFAADLYIGGALGAAQYDYENVNNSQSLELTLGYRFKEKKSHYTAVELNIFDLGEADISWSGVDSNLHMRGSNVSFVYNVVSYGSYTTLSAIKAGVYNIELVDSNNTFGTEKRVSSTGFSAGVAVGGLRMEERLAIYGEIQSYFGVKDQKNNNSVFVYSINMDYFFNTP